MSGWERTEENKKTAERLSPGGHTWSLFTLHGRLLSDEFYLVDRILLGDLVG